MTRVQLRRDPFSRRTLIRQPASHGRCHWCGTQTRRWNYHWQSDDLNPASGDRAKDVDFCGVRCFESYWA